MDLKINSKHFCEMFLPSKLSLTTINMMFIKKKSHVYADKHIVYECITNVILFQLSFINP